MSGIRNAWALVTSLRWEDQAHLATWHLWIVLLVLALLAGAGAHFLLGYGLRFFWRAGRYQWWIAIMTFPMLTASIVALVWCYLLATGAPRLTDRLLESETEGEISLDAQIGAYLLGPAFKHLQSEAATRDQIAKVLAATPQDQLRAALSQAPHQPPPLPGGAESEAKPEAQAPGAEPRTEPPAPGAPAEAATEEETGPVPVIVAIVRDWITDPDQSWPKPAAEEPAPPAGKTPPEKAPAQKGPAEKAPAEKTPPEKAPAREPGSPLSPGEFIVSLIGEVPGDAALSQSDWAYIAGARFEERLLRPLLLEYIEMSAIAVTILVLLLNLIYFWWIHRINRPPAPAKAASPAPQPADPPQREVQGT